uniref:TorD/DmsD family molecular chaperone n=1 Tax=Eggerthella sinensis TaxID=242230 RepID=UPI0022DEEC5C
MTEPLSAELAANLIGFCENRSRVYALLSRCFEKELDAAFAQQLAACDAYSFDDPALDAAFSALRSDVADLDERALEQLAVVFDRVFFGMGPRTAQKAFPYESVYTSEGGLMMQDAYADVLHVYRAARFEKNSGFTEPEDHLAVELAFVARLGERAADELRANDADAAEA